MLENACTNTLHDDQARTGRRVSIRDFRFARYKLLQSNNITRVRMQPIKHWRNEKYTKYAFWIHHRNTSNLVWERCMPAIGCITKQTTQSMSQHDKSSTSKSPCQPHYTCYLRPKYLQNEPKRSHSALLPPNLKSAMHTHISVGNWRANDRKSKARVRTIPQIPNCCSSDSTAVAQKHHIH